VGEHMKNMIGRYGRHCLPLILLGLAACAVDDVRFPGDYRSVEGGRGVLRLVVHIEESQPEQFSGTADDVASGRRGLPLDVIEATSDRLIFTVPHMAGLYEGEWNVESNSWAGL
jgi:hypothetical protein